MTRGRKEERQREGGSRYGERERERERGSAGSTGAGIAEARGGGVYQTEWTQWRRHKLKCMGESVGWG